MGTLVLSRHGQSQWNLENRFTGWTDVPLTERGRADALKCADVLRDMKFDIAFTSRLQRASDTMWIILEELGQTGIPTVEDSALNERHYGDLQGLNKAETATKFGQEQVALWRRSYATRPPGGESIEDCERRVVPFLKQYILPHVFQGKTVFVAASANSMRPFFKYFDGLDETTTATMEVALVSPYIYHFDGEKMTNKEFREVEGIVTLGASTTQARIEDGRI